MKKETTRIITATITFIDASVEGVSAVVPKEITAYEVKRKLQAAFPEADHVNVDQVQDFELDEEAPEGSEDNV